jgi:hypothetical protein
MVSNLEEKMKRKGNETNLELVGIEKLNLENLFLKRQLLINQSPHFQKICILDGVLEEERKKVLISKGLNPDEYIIDPEKWIIKKKEEVK